MDLRVSHSPTCMCGCNFRSFLNLEPGGKKQVTVITGDLGAGKRAILNAILDQCGEDQIGVVIRELGGVPVTDAVSAERVHMFNETSLHVDQQTLLKSYLEKLYVSSACPFDDLLIETNGSDSAERLVELFYRPPIREHYELNSFVTVVDAADPEQNELTAERIVLADHLIINKADCVTNEEAEAFAGRLRQLNPLAEIHKVQFGEIAAWELLESDDYEQVRKASMVIKNGFSGDSHSVILRIEEPLDMQRVNGWIRQVYNKWGDKLLRGKGYFNIIGSDYRFDFQSLRKTFHSKTECEWEDTPRESVVVFIGKDLPAGEELLSGLSMCIASK